MASSYDKALLIKRGLDGVVPSPNHYVMKAYRRCGYKFP
jgi:hypothetical protein